MSRGAAAVSAVSAVFFPGFIDANAVMPTDSVLTDAAPASRSFCFLDRNEFVSFSFLVSACERLSADFKARSDGGTNAARAHAAAAAVAADVATKAAGNKDGYQPLNVASPFLDVETPSPCYRVAKETSVESSPASFSGGENDSRLTQPDRTIPSASSPEEPSASTRAAKTVARFAAAAASKVGAGVAEGARVALPVAREAYKTHAPSVKREAVSLFGTVSSTLQKVWRGGEKQAVRNGRTETVKTPGLKERLGNVFATLRRGSGLFDEKRAKKKKEEEEKKKRKKS